MEPTRADGERPSRLWTRAEYDRMVEAGVLGPEEKVELIEGEILLMSPEGTPHAAILGAAHVALLRAFGPGHWVRPQNPMAADERSEPEPDLIVVPGKSLDYIDHHPSPEESLLVVEVAHSSLRFDLGRKLRLYARDGVPEYWVVDLVHRCIHVHRDPSGSAFRHVERIEPGAAIRPLRASGAVEVSEILG